MRTVTIRTRGAGLSREMAAIREWLDPNQCEPARFHCDQNGDEVVLSVDFRVDTAAEAFGRRLLTATDAGGSQKPNRPKGLKDLQCQLFRRRKQSLRSTAYKRERRENRQGHIAGG